MSQQNNDLNKSLFTVILCAGEGARLREITTNIPKPLIKINALNQKSILHYTIDLLLLLSVKRIAIVKGYLANKIEEFLLKLTRENVDLEQKLFLVDAKNKYKLGPLYSFLSITKNKNIYQTKYIYLIIPGDTIFQYQLFDEIFSCMEENFKLIQTHPLIFFRKIQGSFSEQKNQLKIISVANVEKKKMPKIILRELNRSN